MSDCDHLRPLLGGYVLEALEPAEAAELREHLRGCPECTAEHASLAGLPALLDLSVGVEQPVQPLPPAAEEALLDRVARDRAARPRRRDLRWPPSLDWTRPRVAVAGALIAAALGAGTVAVLGDGAPAAPSGRWNGAYVLPLRAGVAAPGARARVALAKVRGGTSVHLWASGLPAGPGRVYEMRCEGAHLSASAGSFRADASGRVDAQLTTAARVGEYDRIRVIAQGGDEVLAGRIF